MIRANFKFSLPKLEKQIDEVVIQVQKVVALQILTGVVNMTPVRTGRARGNWQVTIGQPSDAYSETKTDKEGGSTISAGRGVIESITTLGAVYLTNNVPYIIPLETGSSTQAPQGMVQVTLDRVAAQFG